MWDKAGRTTTPTVFALRRLMKHLIVNGGVDVFCDFHGHSRKKGAFIYACPGTSFSPHFHPILPPCYPHFTPILPPF